MPFRYACRSLKVGFGIPGSAIAPVDDAVIARVNRGLNHGVRNVAPQRINKIACAAFRVQMRKGYIKDEPLNVIAFCGDGGGADMGLGAISATMCHPDYNLLILMYDNESYANTDIQISGTSPYGVNTSFSTPGKVKRIMNHRWKKNMAPLIMAGHPTVKYVGTISTSYPLQAMNNVRKALSIGGPTFIHCLNPVQRAGISIPCFLSNWANWP
jgi:pyruvate/2-oxoacid:ferredoxin oxidoreductase beta subunit